MTPSRWVARLGMGKNEPWTREGRRLGGSHKISWLFAEERPKTRLKLLIR
jgi:hypothetical protein